LVQFVWFDWILRCHLVCASSQEQLPYRGQNYLNSGSQPEMSVSLKEYVQLSNLHPTEANWNALYKEIIGIVFYIKRNDYISLCRLNAYLSQRLTFLSLTVFRRRRVYDIDQAQIKSDQRGRNLGKHRSLRRSGALSIGSVPRLYILFIQCILKSNIFMETLKYPRTASSLVHSYSFYSYQFPEFKGSLSIDENFILRSRKPLLIFSNFKFLLVCI